MKKEETRTPRLARSVLAAALSLFSTLPAIAQESSAAGESLFFEEIPPVLTATRLTQPRRDIPASITVIDSDTIRASGAIELVDLLRLVPGFQIGRVTNGKYTATYHGNSDAFARDLQVLVDGRSVYDPTFGGVSWKDIPISIGEIDRVEVIRGPNAAAYGSNSFSAIVNIISKTPEETRGGAVELTAGSEKTHSIAGQYSGRQGATAYRLSFGSRSDDGFETRNDDSSTRWIRLSTTSDINASNRIAFELGATQGETARGFPGDAIQPFRDEDHSSNYQKLTWTRFYAPGDELRLTGYHNRLSLGDDFDVPPAFHMGYGFVSDRYDLELQRTLNLNETTRLVAGFGARQDESRGYWIYNRPDTFYRGMLRGFFNLEKRFAETTLNLGMMYEKFERKSGLFSPRLGINRRLNETGTLRFSASRAYRVPTLFEDYADLGIKLGAVTVSSLILGGQKLDPEQITAYEVGYVGEFKSLGLTLDAKLFREQIRNGIALYEDDSTAESFNITNDGWLNLHGLEIDLDWRATMDTRVRLGYSLQRASCLTLDEITGGVRSYKVIDNRVPEQTASLLLSQRLPRGYQLGIAYYYLDQFTWGGDGDRTDPANRLDLTIARDFRLNGARLNLQLLLQNLANEQYQDFYYKVGTPSESNTWDRRVYLRAGLQW